MKSSILNTVTIGAQFPCLLEYGDSEMSAAELRAAINWHARNEALAIREHGESARVLYQYGDSSEFAICDITGLPSDCVTCEIIAIYP
jgi:hypothetical protein